ncbi:hypothetical protein [Epilithonimonas sp.]|uniref:A1S_2505 family phage non-structural protein n=1 Tax=Epilithonimonas sp. TaxID=2894511 RepID=UPI0035B43958
MTKQFTPENINELLENEVFVFGSNLNGNHAGGAAKIALDKFGAINGNPQGLQGKSYALPTLGKDMNKLSLDEISQNIDTLYFFAREKQDLIFLVTKIGCGIAGFDEEEISNLFKSKDKPENIVLPVEFTFIKGFKGFDKDLKCRNFQFEEGKKYIHKGDVKACSGGFHFCEMPLDIFNYYPPINGNQFYSVEGSGKSDKENSDSKVAVEKLKINTKLSVHLLFKLHFDLLWKKIKVDKKETINSTTGYKAHSSTTGNYAHSSTTGNYAHSSTTGEEAHSSTTGYKAHSSTTGNYAHSSTTGYKAHSSTTGEEAISSALGFQSKAKSEKGWIIIVDWKVDENYNRKINAIYSAKVGDKILNKIIKPNHNYWFEDGKLKSEKS